MISASHSHQQQSVANRWGRFARSVAGCACLAAVVAVAGCGQAGSASSGTAQSMASAQGRVDFVLGYEAGYRRALAEGKPLLIVFTADWCGHCHRLLNENFCEDTVRSLSEHFVCVLVDAEAEPATCRDFRVRHYPTIQFVSPRGVPLNRLTGSQPSKRLVHEMQATLEAIARRATDSARVMR